MLNKKVFTLIVFAALLVGGVPGAEAAGRTSLAHLHAGQVSRVPIGWVQFCQDNPRECHVAAGAAPATMTLTDARLRELVEVNLRFNRQIKPVTDQDQYGVVERWTYATTGKGAASWRGAAGRCRHC
jgi:predicted transglutaminase-like cysteine proteinase